MFLIIVFIILFGIMMAAKSTKTVGNRRCWDAKPGESKVHRWILQDVPGSKQILLVCKVCGQKPGEE